MPIIYFSGFRRSDLRYVKRYPENIMLTFEDLSRKHGDGEQIVLFRDWLKYRRRKRRRR